MYSTREGVSLQPLDDRAVFFFFGDKLRIPLGRLRSPDHCLLIRFPLLVVVEERGEEGVEEEEQV